MIGTSATWPIAVRVALSGFLGVVASVLLILAYRSHGDPSLAHGSWFVGVLWVFAVTLLVLQAALLLAGPLILIAIVCGVLLRRSIERHLLAWSYAAPVIVWLFACMVVALTSRNQYFATHDFLHNLAVVILARENLLFLFGPFVSGVIFYALSVPRHRRPL